MTTEEIEDCIATGRRIDGGDHYIDRTLMIWGGRMLKGRVRSRLLPAEAFVGSTLVWAQSMAAGVHDGVEGDADETGLPRGGLVEDVTLYGLDPAAPSAVFGLWLEGARFRFRNVRIMQCHYGLSVAWSVDTVFRDCVFSQNYINVDIRGDSSGRSSVTTTRFEDCQIRQAIHTSGIPHSGTGVYAQTGHHTMFIRSIFESNAGAPLIATHGVQSPIVNVDPWLENNGGPVIDAGGKYLVIREKTY